MARFTSTYLGLDAPHRWLRGNHHGHSTVSDGELDPQDIVRHYEAAGHDYLALSEHDSLLKADALRAHTSMCIIQAVEVTSRFGQTLMHLGADRTLPPHELTPREIMEQAHAAGGLFIFDHPNWRPWADYATDELLDTMEGMRGMEIYTGVVERLSGEAKATDRWDRLLGKGWRVFGHATDDQHRADDCFVAWNCVQWPGDQPVTPEGIVDALAAGRFYASNGVTISRTGASDDGQAVMVESDADEVRWIVRAGAIVKKVGAGSSTLMMDEFAALPDVPRTESGCPSEAIYARAECLGRGATTAWTQPFWITT